MSYILYLYMFHHQTFGFNTLFNPITFYELRSVGYLIFFYINALCKSNQNLAMNNNFCFSSKQMFNNN